MYVFFKAQDLTWVPRFAAGDGDVASQSMIAKRLVSREIVIRIHASELQGQVGTSNSAGSKYTILRAVLITENIAWTEQMKVVRVPALIASATSSSAITFV